jgi:hypothetical protein
LVPLVSALLQRLVPTAASTASAKVALRSSCQLKPSAPPRLRSRRSDLQLLNQFSGIRQGGILTPPSPPCAPGSPFAVIAPLTAPCAPPPPSPSSFIRFWYSESNCVFGADAVGPPNPPAGPPFWKQSRAMWPAGDDVSGLMEWKDEDLPPPHCLQMTLAEKFLAWGHSNFR